MKVTNYASAVAFALLYSSQVSAVQLSKVISQFVPEENIYIQWGGADDISYSDYDKEYKPTALAEQMQNELYNAPYVPRKINDKDGDGVEDNVKKTQEELDRFIKPAVFGADVIDIHNTAHGNLPGHVRAGEDTVPKLLAATNANATAVAKPILAAVNATLPAEIATSAAVNDTLPAEIAITMANKPTDATKLMSETDEIAVATKAQNENSESDFDKEYVQMEESSSQDLLSKFIDVVNSPEDLSDDNLLMWKAGANKIYDADGDGVEDNVHMTHDELDRFNIPNRFFPAEHIYNTRNGNLPGHIQREFYEGAQPEPQSMDLVKKAWKKW